jgi:hypothetical protein
MTVSELIHALAKHPGRSKVELVIVRGDDERLYTEAAGVRVAKDYTGRVTVEITNEP